MIDGLNIDNSGIKRYYLNNLSHREDGPAIEYPNGDTSWYLYGKQHRIDGPANDWGDRIKLWYYHGELIECRDQETFEKFLKFKAFW